jgi:hypothetical protein
MLMVIPRDFEIDRYTRELQRSGNLLARGGFWMIQVRSKEEAIEWAKRAPAPDGHVIEVRQVEEMADFSQPRN